MQPAINPIKYPDAVAAIMKSGMFAPCALRGNMVSCIPCPTKRSAVEKSSDVKLSGVDIVLLLIPDF